MEKIFFLAKTKHQYHISQWEEHVYDGLSPKGMEIIMGTSFVSFWGINLYFKENNTKNFFLRNQNINIVYPNEENMSMVPKSQNKRKIVKSIHVCLIWWTNFDSSENGGKKSFSCETKG